jgi:CBS domain containing-hemolysin-like protein
MGQTAFDVGIRFAAVLALVLANGFFVAAEFSLVTVRKTRVDQLIAEGNRMARAVREAISNPERYIAATQLGITMASLGLGWIGEPAVADTLRPVFAGLPAPLGALSAHSVSVAIAFALITALHIVLGELAPKTIALQQTEKTALLVVKPTQWFMWTLWPFIALLNGMGLAAVRALGLKPPSGHSMVHSEEELKMLVTASQEAGVIEEDEEQMLHRVFGFGDLTAGQVMLPRTEMATVRADASLQQVLALAAREPHLWVAVCREGPDDIVGMLHVKDLFKAVLKGGEPFTLLDWVREVLTVPETMSADDVLNEMRNHRTHHAVVIDEYGGTAGLVTFAGLMERIVGEVGSDFGPAGSRISLLPDGSALLDGLALTQDVNERFGLHIDESTYHTIGGYVLGRLGRRARLGDRVDAEGSMLRVEALDGMRVARVLLSAPRKEARTQAGEGR